MDYCVRLSCPYCHKTRNFEKVVTFRTSAPRNNLYHIKYKCVDCSGTFIMEYREKTEEEVR